MIEFKSWPKTTRRKSKCTISEKLHGSNGALAFEVTDDSPTDGREIYVLDIQMATQTRNRIVTVQDDQTGIARWAEANRDTLVMDLLHVNRMLPEPGLYYHYGEFMTRGHTEPHFYLFNTRRWTGVQFRTPTLKVVPVLYEGDYYDGVVEECLEDLRQNGSKAHPGTPAEGVVVYYPGNDTMFKDYTGLVKK
jgi:hypothetical protein